jgi:hypothetical protein
VAQGAVNRRFAGAMDDEEKKLVGEYLINIALLDPSGE